MTPEMQDAVIQKQAWANAQLTLQNTVLEVELEQAKARIEELEAGNAS